MDEEAFNPEAMLKELENLQQTNPEEYAKLTEAMSMYSTQMQMQQQGGEESKTMFDTSGSAGGIMSSEALRKMAQDIKTMRTTGGGESGVDVDSNLSVTKDKRVIEQSCDIQIQVQVLCDTKYFYHSPTNLTAARKDNYT